MPELIQNALVAAADCPGLSDGVGHRRSCATRSPAGWSGGWAPRDVTHRHVLPIVGSKELVAWLPTQLGLGPGDRVAYPRLAYPTYEVGARLARARARGRTTTRPSSTRPV